MGAKEAMEMAVAGLLIPGGFAPDYLRRSSYHPTLACARVGAPERASGRRHLVGA
ncbi:hypothetical protein [Thermus caldifontis]|uniref:hypothetical protein n=1 Tax=Thermus caldifontis TaxID=1930763 RepID=UPI001F08096A|nr:hypothetical protein [Thermus caldifontis]